MRSTLRALPHPTRSIAPLLLLLLLPAPQLHGQRIVVSTVDTKEFPTVKAEVYVLGTDGREIRDVRPDEVVVTENGERRQVISLVCPPAPKPRMISSVLTIDVSGSMESAGRGGTVRNITLAQAAANAWVDGLPNDGSDCALTTFDSRGLIYLDFSRDLNLLRSSIALLEPHGGTDYNAGLLNSPSGALPVVASGRGRRVIVFLTDGLGGGNEERIVEGARSLNASIFCVTLGMPAPDILKNIAARTGGACYENVTTVEEAQAIYRAILHQAVGGLPCELVWRSAGSCDAKREVGITVPSRALSGASAYRVPPETMPGLRIDPPVLFFGNVPAGERREMTASITAINKPVTVTGLEASSTSGAMTLDGISTPFTLQPGESRVMTIRYAPTDDASTSVRWRFTNDGCNGGMLLATSSGNRRQDPSIHLMAPNGGERFRPGEATTIRWEGIAAETAVKLEYSTNAGASWIVVSPKTSGLRYDWTVPGTPSDRCYARVTELGTDGAPIPPILGDMSARHRSIGSIALSADGSMVITTTRGEEGRVVVWSASSGSMLMELKNRDIRNNSGLKPQIYYAGFSPDGKRIITANYGRVVGSTTYVEQYIELFDAATGRPIASFKGTLANGSMWVAGVRTPDLKSTGENDKIPTASPFSPDGTQFIAVADSVPVIYDAATGRPLRKLAVPVATVQSARFSPDGRMIATAGVDGTARLFDAGTGREIRRFSHGEMITQIDFSPDGSILGASCDDDTVRFHDVATGRTVTAIAAAKKAPDHQPNTFIFAPGGAQVLISNWGRMSPTLYTIPGGAVVRVYTEIDDGARYPARQVPGNFSADGSLLVFTGEDRTDEAEGYDYKVRIVDVATGMIVARSVVSSISHEAKFGTFTPDGSAVVTGGDGVPIIQPIGGGSIQQDRSDALWAIIESKPSAIDVAFGRHGIGEVTDSVITALIRNDGSDTLIVGGMTISDNDDMEVGGAGDFGIVAAPTPLVVPPGGTARAELRFKPTVIGPRSAILEIEAGGRTLRQLLTGEGVAPHLRIATQSIDFGNVLVGTRADTTITLMLRNDGPRPLTLRNIMMIGPDTSHFTILDGGDGMTIRPGETEEMSFRFAPDTIGRRSTRLVVRHDGLGGEETIDLYGRGVVPGMDRMWHDPTTFRSIAIPNAIVPEKGRIVLGVYDVVGLMVGYVPIDNVMIIAGGGVPLPDDWGGVNGQMYGAWSLGVKGGVWVVDQLNVGGGFQYAVSFYDKEETDETESRIAIATPYVTASYGDDDRRVSITGGYAFKKHHRFNEIIDVVEEFDRDAILVGIGGDYRFASRWKVAAEILTMETLGYIPIGVTIRYFGDTWAIDGGLGYVGITTGGGEAPSAPVVPVVSWVVVF